MPSTVFTQFDGYIPGVDVRSLKNASVLSGANFEHTLLGPRSSFGSIAIVGGVLSASARSYALDVEDEIWYGTSEGLFRYDTTACVMRCMLNVTTIDADWPWSVAYVGKKYYFSQYQIGLWEWDPDTYTMRHVVTPVFDNILFAAAYGGRLLLLSTNYTLWSAQDDGSDLEPSLATGAGAQGLRSLLGGIAYRIDPVVDGFLVATSRGLIKATKVDEIYVYSWNGSWSRDIRIPSPNCGVTVPDAGTIYLTAAGFYLVANNVNTSSSYSLFEKWMPLFGDYFSSTYMKNVTAARIASTMMYYSRALRSVFIGSTTQGDSSAFSQIFCYNVDSQKFGILTKSCRSVVDVIVDAQRFVGYVTLDGLLRQCTDQPFEVDAGISVASARQSWFHVPSEIPMLIYVEDVDADSNGIVDSVTTVDDDGIETTVLDQTVSYLGASDISMVDFELVMIPETVVSGAASFASVDRFVTSEVVSATLVENIAQESISMSSGFSLPEWSAANTTNSELQSTLRLGPFRIGAQDFAATSCTIDKILINSAASSASEVTEDYLLGDADILDDFNTGSGTEDYGVIELDVADCEVFYSMTVDGVTAPIVDRLALMGYAHDRNTVYDTPPYEGLYAVLDLEANEANQYFDIQYLELGGQVAGH